MRWWGLAVVSCGFAMLAQAQVGEISVSGGVSRFGDVSLGTSADASGNAVNVTLQNGFRLAVRLTINTYRFAGHEFGYAYSHSNVALGGTSNPTPVHQGFYDFLLYATPEGSRIRPFAAGGIQFSSFFPPGASVYQGNGTTKFGINGGAGIKVRVTPIIGLRFDVRDYNTGKPFNFTGQSGRLNQMEISVGASFLF